MMPAISMFGVKYDGCDICMGVKNNACDINVWSEE